MTHTSARQRFANLTNESRAAELPMPVAIALTFVAEPVFIVNYLPGGLASLLLLAAQVRPNRAAVSRSEAALDQDGGRSQPSQAFGY